MTDDASMSIAVIVTKLVLFALWLIAVAAPPYLVWLWLRSRQPAAAPRPMIVDGANRIVPVVATFSGVRALAWIGIGRNNLNPRLVLGPTGIDYKVLRRQQRRYNQIERVDLRIFGATVNLCFVFWNDVITFDANVGNLALAAEVLDRLSPHVALTGRARDFIVRRAAEGGNHTGDPAKAAQATPPRFRFQPRWKEELVVTADEGSFVLVLAMGIPTAYLPRQADWESTALEWARPLWMILRDELEKWCRDSQINLVVGGP